MYKIVNFWVKLSGYPVQLNRIYRALKPLLVKNDSIDTIAPEIDHKECGNA
jgi:hypothetical protein